MSTEIRKGPDGLYTLCVFCTNMPSENEVRNEFEKFGSIVRMNRYKDMIVFVRFSSKEEATECYTKMQDHPLYTVNPGKSNSNDTNTNMNRGGGDFNNRGEGDCRRSDNRRRHDEGGNSRRMENGGNNLGDSSFKSFGGSRGSLSNGPNISMPKLIPSTMVTPRTSKGEEKTQSDKIIAKILAIGNLPPGTKQCAIYTMCEKCKVMKPLHVTMKMINRPPYPTINYAIVYVRNDTEVQSICTGLNDLVYNESKLIAHPIEELVEIGKTGKF